MENYIGKWRLEKNINLDGFLEYYGYNWLSRKAASCAEVDAIFEKTSSPNVIKRTIDSTFMKNSEFYKFDGKFYLNPENLKKKHLLKNNIIYTEVHKSTGNWNEQLSVEEDNLIVTRHWYRNKIMEKCIQIFKKVT